MVCVCQQGVQGADHRQAQPSARTEDGGQHTLSGWQVCAQQKGLSRYHFGLHQDESHWGVHPFHSPIFQSLVNSEWKQEEDGYTEPS